MLIKSLSFAAAAALMVTPALAQDNPPAEAAAPTAEAEITAPEAGAPAPEAEAETPAENSLTNRSLDDLKSGIDKGDELPGCRQKDQHVA